MRKQEGHAASEQGFTLLELIIVVAIIGILATIAMPALKNVPVHAKEAVLKTNLHTLRDVIDQYYGDKGKYPTSLDELVEKGYLKKVPVDPMTRQSDSWVLTYEEVDPENPGPETGQNDEGQPGITDVHSGSPLKAIDGTPYSEW